MYLFWFCFNKYLMAEIEAFDFTRNFTGWPSNMKNSETGEAIFEAWFLLVLRSKIHIDFALTIWCIYHFGCIQTLAYWLCCNWSIEAIQAVRVHRLFSYDLWTIFSFFQSLAYCRVTFSSEWLVWVHSFISFGASFIWMYA